MNQAIKLTNSDITWSGTRIGFTPTIINSTKENITDFDDRDIPDLLRLLAEPDSFVAAHVVLTQISGVEYTSFPTWNGLEIQIDADGTVYINAEQRFILMERWNRWYSTSPKPATLPGL